MGTTEQRARIWGTFKKVATQAQKLHNGLVIQSTPCPQCGNVIEFDAEEIGFMADCPACGRSVALKAKPAPAKPKPVSGRKAFAAVVVMIVTVFGAGSAVGYLILHDGLFDRAWEIGVLIAALVVYWVPFLVAVYRRHRNCEAIFVLNLFLGWTYLGWVAALVWALVKD